jgi:disulfide bond formation protein DsbB
MYPQLIILGLGYFMKDSKASFYALILAILGTPIALFHYMLQRGVVDFGCSVVGNYSVSCAKYFSMTYGYITIPMMAFTAFLMIIMFLSLNRGITQGE